jgi:hypothetical protein
MTKKNIPSCVGAASNHDIESSVRAQTPDASTPPSAHPVGNFLPRLIRARPGGMLHRPILTWGRSISNLVEPPDRLRRRASRTDYADAPNSIGCTYPMSALRGVQLHSQERPGYPLLVSRVPPTLKKKKAQGLSTYSAPPTADGAPLSLALFPLAQHYGKRDRCFLACEE